MNIPLALLGMAISIIFAGGVAWTTLQQVRKDLNGMGAKFGRFKDHDTRMVITLLVLADKRADREAIARNLMEW
jgi:hypothetical protein